MPHKLVARMNGMVNETGVQLMELWFFNDNLYIPTNGQTLKHILDSNEEITKGEEYDAIIPWLVPDFSQVLEISGDHDERCSLRPSISQC
ncbi:hypothetical protein PENTCL1PPCAC_20278 [Pristionchus entomophagus]|uniref:Uncharacterized protein n=1 Tax=Pristionchus entomophagus TaxID=358040 RepID=A0AAV5TVS8_9BILA|nr:hypothetical protein PENTCL1PPCAC_20278 [Pristionchus entomophagus]